MKPQAVIVSHSCGHSLGKVPHVCLDGNEASGPILHLEIEIRRLRIVVTSSFLSNPFPRCISLGSVSSGCPTMWLRRWRPWRRIPGGIWSQTHGPMGWHLSKNRSCSATIRNEWPLGWRGCCRQAGGGGKSERICFCCHCSNKPKRPTKPIRQKDRQRTTNERNKQMSE